MALTSFFIYKRRADLELQLTLMHWLVISFISFFGGLTKYLNLPKKNIINSRASIFFAGISLSLFIGILVGALCFYFEMDLFRTIFFCGFMSFFSNRLILLVNPKHF